jgi:hypothetical protein
MVRRQAEIRAESVCWAESVDISPPVRHPLADVVHAARNAWETRKMEFGNYDASTDDAGQDFLDRIAVNFLRHRMTDYDAMLRERFGLAGVDDAARIIRRRVLAAIAAAYPELRAECERQESTR